MGIELALGPSQLAAMAPFPGLPPCGLLLLPGGQLSLVALAVQIPVLLAVALLPGLIPAGSRAAVARITLLSESAEAALNLTQGRQLAADRPAGLAAETGLLLPL